MTLVKFRTAPVKTIFPEFRDAFGQTGRPAVNVVEAAEGFEIELAAPGLLREDFSINVEEGILTISTNKQATAQEPGSVNYRRREFSYANFERSFRLPDTVDVEGIKAVYTNGILRVTLAFKPEVKPVVHTIEVA